jgi:glycoside/pentoside/hexuronide:cation symporter, GPH family
MSRRKMIALAAPAVPMSALTVPLVTFLPEFYANSIGLPLTLVGLVFMSVRLIDIAADPILGGLMDRTKTPWGRYKPWLVIGAPVAMAGAFFLFTAQPGIGPAYLFVWLLTTYLGYSILMLAQLSLASAQTRTYDERARVFGWVQIGYTLGIVLVMALPVLLGAGHGGDRIKFMQSMAWVILILAPITVLWACLGVPDSARAQKTDHAGLREYFALLRRRSTRLLLTADLLLGLATGLFSATGTVFMCGVKRLSIAEYGIALVIAFTIAIAAAPFWSFVAIRIGKHRTMALGALCNICHLSGLYLVPNGEPLYVYAVGAFSGFGFAALNLMPRAMLADINDEEVLEHGVDRNGLLYALLIGIYKIGQAVAVAASFWALDMFHYVPALVEKNSPQVLANVGWLFFAAPSALTLAGAILVLRYPLTAARHAEIRRALDRRELAAQPAE